MSPSPGARVQPPPGQRPGPIPGHTVIPSLGQADSEPEEAPGGRGRKPSRLGFHWDGACLMCGPLLPRLRTQQAAGEAWPQQGRPVGLSQREHVCTCAHVSCLSPHAHGPWPSRDPCGKAHLEGPFRGAQDPRSPQQVEGPAVRPTPVAVFPQPLPLPWVRSRPRHLPAGCPGRTRLLAGSAGGGGSVGGAANMAAWSWCCAWDRSARCEVDRWGPGP